MELRTEVSRVAYPNSSLACKKVRFYFHKFRFLLVTAEKFKLIIGHTRTKNYTRGGTTSESHDKEDDNYRYNALGEYLSIVPKALFVMRKSN